MARRRPRWTADPRPVEGWSARGAQRRPSAGRTPFRPPYPGFPHPSGIRSSGAMNQRPLRGPSTQPVGDERIGQSGVSSRDGGEINGAHRFRYALNGAPLNQRSCCRSAGGSNPPRRFDTARTTKARLLNRRGGGQPAGLTFADSGVAGAVPDRGGQVIHEPFATFHTVMTVVLTLSAILSRNGQLSWWPRRGR